MCGISGIYTARITAQHQHVIDAVVKSQILRGPDHQETIIIKGRQSQVLLGHNRLSIIDLSQQANQPMWDVTGRYCIVYNGEIYNYVELRKELEHAGLTFNTRSDTEVILNSFSYWGIAALQRFHGPFAFSIFDVQDEKLILCRDRFGVRPLYYIKINHTFYFASTTEALAKALNLKPNYSYVARGLKYLVYEDGSDISPYQDMLSLPSGCYMVTTFSTDEKLKCDVNAYYDLTTNVQNLMETIPINDPDAMLQLLISKFERAIDIRLRTDVPLAISLSGGLDSSSIASLVSRQHHNTIGFSFSHPSNRKSEGILVADCAKFLDIKIEYIWPSPDEMIEAIYKTVAIQDAPFPTLSIVAQYLLYERVRACGIKVLLGGQGGDEAFMGYKKFMLFWLQLLLNEKRYFSITKNILQLLPMFFSEITSLKSYWHHRHRYMSKSKQHHSALKLGVPPVLRLNDERQILWKRQMQDITQFSLPTLLRYEDRNAMGNSVESRLPYLDHQLIEFGLALPYAIKLRAGYGKWIVREMMRNKIPDSIRLARYKRGFDIPLAALLKSGMGQSIRSTLQASRHVINDFLQSSTDINKVFSDQQFLQRQHTLSEAITLLWLNKALA
jgi:asparagine synthase (glutamine-hydrolysing)